MRRGPRKPNWPFVLNRDSRQAHGLIGWWPGGPSGGLKLLDMSGFGRHGTLTNFATPYTTTSGWVSGKDGGSGAVYFDGTDDFANLGDTFGGMTAGTWCCWFLVADYSGREHALIAKFGNEAAYDASDSFVLGYTPFATRGLQMSIGGPNAFTVTGDLVLGTVYHGAGTYDGANVKVYLNGVLKSTTAATGALNAAAGTNTYIGGEVAGAPGGNQTGWVEDARIYNRALSANEIWEIYDPKTRWELRWQPSQTMRSFRTPGNVSQYGRRARPMSGGFIDMDL